MNTPPALSYSTTLAELTADKWEMVSEGPSGAQLKHPRQMKTQTKVVLGLGVVALAFYGVGLIFIGVALIDYLMTKEQAHFLSREDPQLPATLPEMSAVSKVVWGIFFGLIVIGLIGAMVS